MGYNTQFHLSAIPSDVDVDKLFTDNVEYCDCYGGNVNGGESMKWYQHEKDMIRLSKLHPTIVFILDGEGEDAGDQWRKFFINGAVEEHKAEWTAPSKPTGLVIPEYVSPSRLHVPSDHILASVLDGKEYSLFGTDPVRTGEDAEVVVEGCKITVPNAWLDEDA